MLDHETNRKLSQVGADTPMGALLRRYWHPVAGSAEMERQPTMPIRLMGEDLVLYRDLSGGYGLLDRHCCHRRADLCFGFVEDKGLRCSYHGWLYDALGACIEQPFEDTAAPDSRFKDKIRIKSYPVEEKAGLLWAYLGPDPAPLVPTWEPFTWANGFRQVVLSVIPCNWFQCQENSIDPVHFEWQHENWRVRASGAAGPYAPKHLRIDFEEFDHGISYKRIRENTGEDHPLWTVGRNCLWPNALFTGDHFEWRVPIDDDNTLSVGWFFNPVPKDRRPFAQNEIPCWRGPDQGRRRAVDHQPRDEPGLRRLGRPGDARRPFPGASRTQRPRCDHDAQAFPRGPRPHRAEPRTPRRSCAIRPSTIASRFPYSTATSLSTDRSGTS